MQGRRTVRVAVPLVLALVVILYPGFAHAGAAPEKPRLTVGLAGHTKSYLTLYVARERTAQSEGLELELVAFGGGSRAAAAAVSGSVDVGLASLDTLISAVSGGQPIRAFYGGFNHADFEWFALPGVATWEDLRGRTVAVSAYGSLTDFLTRHVLRKHGLEPGRHVHIMQGGGPSTRWQALRAGRVGAAILQTPLKWQAQADGFTRVGTQAEEIGREWPTNVMFARDEFLERHPWTVRALLRAHVRALRLVRSDRELGISVLMRSMKVGRPEAERSYDDAVAGFDERGRLPAQVMPIFWEIAVAAGEVVTPWAESRFLDRRFIDTFETWAPR
jgi:NitT/TauT family transport system substrate-binding protein